MSESITARRKRLIHRSRYRGCREADLIFGRFADAHVKTMDLHQLDQYQSLLEESDQDLLAWFTDREIPPDRHCNDVFKMIKRFTATVAGT